MRFDTILSSALICNNIQGDSKIAVFKEMIDMLASYDERDNSTPLLHSILARESKSSTALRNGIAFPHASTDAAKELRVAFGIKKDGIDFNSQDGLPTRIIILITHPQRQHNDYMKCLAGFSRILRVSENREKLMVAENKETITRILRDMQVSSIPQLSF